MNTQIINLNEEEEITNQNNNSKDDKRLKEESALAMAERTIRRLWITTIILIVLMAGMSIGFFVYESQFEDVVETSEYDADVDALQFGDDNFVAGGDINYGTVNESETP